MLGATEAVLRDRGYIPFVSDGKIAWAVQRLRVETAGPEMVVLLGASRAHLGFSPLAFEQALPGHPVINLALNAHDPLAAFQDIAENTGFAGTVLFSFHPKFDLFVGQDQAVCVQYYNDNFAHIGRYERLLSYRVERFLQHRLALLSPNSNWTTLVTDRLHPPRTSFDDRRWRKVDFRGMSPKELGAQRKLRLEGISAKVQAAPTPNVAEFEPTLAVLARSTRMIQARGGKVIFVRYPSSGPHYELECMKCPRELFWDKIQPATGAISLYWSDYPELREFDTLDYSHLDQRDAEDFTRRLAHLVAQELGLVLN